MIIPVIMSGGAGTRLWPASRENRPKQFLPLFDRHSTFQETVRRVSEPGLFGRPVIVTNVQHRFVVAEQLAEIGVEADIVLEPARRDSGPAILAGALVAAKRDPAAIVLALAADHVISDNAGFCMTCARAEPAAAKGFIVTFGVQPSRPASEYGYIRPGAEVLSDISAVANFVEKPDTATAARYVADGYLWNSGNFLFRVDVLLGEYRRYAERSAQEVVASVENAGRDLGFITLDREAFSAADAQSIDYAVMEHTDKAAVVPANYAWSDVGSWQAVWEQTRRDQNGNAVKGSAVLANSRNSYVSSDKQVIAVVGLDNVAVVATDDAVLVAALGDASGLKDVVKQLKDTTPQITEDHAKVHRPWGSYRSVDSGERFQVKRIIVKPNGRLSLQKHHHRAEHWIVVHGTAQVTIGDLVKIVHENESVYVPIGATHRLENPGKIDLEMIEVQTGSYLGEDDIVRIDDDYHRS